MSFQANVLKVMIASPGDVARERDIATDAIHRWNAAHATSRNIVLLPVRWETNTTPQMGKPPQSIIDRQILDDADIVIAIFGTRIGTPTEQFVSGTVEEIKKHVASRKTAKVYFSNVPVPPSSINAAQYEAVKQFQEECRGTGLYQTFDSVDQFRQDVAHHLDIELNELKYRWMPAVSSTPVDAKSDLSNDAVELLLAASEDGSAGEIVSQRTGQVGLQTGDHKFATGSARSQARWEAVLNELIEGGLAERTGPRQAKLTNSGYVLADKVAEQRSATSAENSFKDFQQEHVLGLISDLNPMQRDFLRLLLLRGGSLRADAIATAAAHSPNSHNVSQLGRPLAQRGLVTEKVDLIEGFVTYSLNSGIEGALSQLLIPREEQENYTPYFKGIPMSTK